MKRHWQIRRQFQPTADGARRWDQVYQSLLQWTTPTAPSAVPAPSLTRQAEVFRNFVLQLEWLSFNPAGPNNDNSGIFLRFPALNASNPTNDWKLAVDRGYEVQIDDTGFNPATGQRGEPRHQTGAIYTLVPASRVASKPAGEWNTYVIEALTDRISVRLNGELVTDYVTDGSRPPAGHIGFQNHTGKVQFRNIMLRTLAD